MVAPAEPPTDQWQRCTGHLAGERAARRLHSVEIGGPLRDVAAKIVPDLAESWSWSPDQTKLTFKLRQGVKWHDGKLFTAKDVACTFDLLLSGESKLRRNPHAAWWTNVEKVTIESDTQATFHLKAPQPSLIALLAWFTMTNR